MRQVGDDCLQRVKFFPLPVKTLDGWHQQAIQVVRRLALQLARHTGSLESEVTSHLFERLSILLMKGNAALLLSRSLDFASQEIDGVVDS